MTKMGMAGVAQEFMSYEGLGLANQKRQKLRVFDRKLGGGGGLLFSYHVGVFLSF